MSLSYLLIFESDTLFFFVNIFKSLYIHCIRIPYQMYNLQMFFSHSGFYLFTLLICSNAIDSYTVLIFCEVQFVCFFISCLCLVSYLKNHCQIQGCEPFALCFLLSIAVLGFTLRIVILSYLLYTVLSKGPISFFACGYHFYNTIYWKDCPFPIVWSWYPCQKSFDFICEFISQFSILFNCCICLSARPVLFWLL